MQPVVVLAAGAFQIKHSASRNGPRSDSDTLPHTRRRFPDAGKKRRPPTTLAAISSDLACGCCAVQGYPTRNQQPRQVWILLAPTVAIAE